MYRGKYQPVHVEDYIIIPRAPIGFLAAGANVYVIGLRSDVSPPEKDFFLIHF